MKKKHLIYSDLLRRKIFIKLEIKQKILKSAEKTVFIPNTYRYLSLYFKSISPRRASIIQQVNRCFLTGRPWYVQKYTRYSRFKFRTESNQGNLPGFKRASW